MDCANLFDRSGSSEYGHDHRELRICAGTAIWHDALKNISNTTTNWKIHNIIINGRWRFKIINRTQLVRVN
jgi:hypothetical protein